MKDFIVKTTWSTASLILRLFANFFVYILIARILGPEKFGAFSYYILVGSILLLISDFGVHQRYYKVLAVNEECKNSIISIKIVLTSFALAAGVVASLYTGDYNFLLVGASFLLNSLFDFALIGVRAEDRFRAEAFYTLINNSSFVVIITLVAWLHQNVDALCISMTFARLASLIILQKKELVSIGSWPKLIHPKDMIKQLNYGIDYVLINIWSFMDGLVVKSFFSIQQFGIYSSYTRLTNGAGSLSIIFTNILFKDLTVEAKSGGVNLLIKSTLLFLMIGAIMLGFAYVFGQNLIVSILGVEYKQDENLLFYLCIPVALKWISSAFGIYLFALDHIWLRVTVQVIGLLGFFGTFFSLMTYELGLITLPISMSVSYFLILIGYLVGIVKVRNG